MSHCKKLCTPDAKSVVLVFPKCRRDLGMKTVDSVWEMSASRGDLDEEARGESDGRKEAGKSVRNRIGR